MNDALMRIDGEIASMEARISALMYARAIVAGESVGSAIPTIEGPPAKKPEPPVQQPAAIGGTVTQERRQMIAALLKSHGPSGMTDIANMMGIEYSLARRCIIDHPWFEKSPGKGRQSWRLTEAGQLAGAGA